VLEVQSAVSPTVEINIHMAGDVYVARQICRQYCMKVGLCVTVSLQNFIYTGGEEFGFVVGLRNYPRFPTTLEDLQDHAEMLVDLLVDGLHQHSAMIVGPEETLWVSRRKE